MESHSAYKRPNSNQKDIEMEPYQGHNQSQYIIKDIYGSESGRRSDFTDVSEPQIEADKELTYTFNKLKDMHDSMVKELKAHLASLQHNFVETHSYR